MILGSCFLATTGAEALYSDMGHVGRGNIYATWPFVKICLILSYLGQGAWLLANAGNPELALIEDLNPFFQMLPEMVRPFGVILSTCAAIVASRRSVTGAFSLVSEASRLDLMPHMQIFYPGRDQGPALHPHGQQRHVGRLRYRRCACSRAPLTWRPPTAWPSPSR